MRGARFNDIATACTAVVIALLAGAGPATARPSADAAEAAGTAARHTASFATRSSLGVRCTLGDRPGGLVGVECRSIRQRPLYRQKATLGAGGRTAFCRERGAGDHCRIGKHLATARMLGVGRSLTVGRFRCQVQRGAVRCTVRATGRGFLISSARVAAVGAGGGGGAGGVPKGKGPVLHLTEFISPDHKVWCASEASSEEVEGENICGTGFTVAANGILQAVYPQSLAELSPAGAVKICSIAVAPPPGTPGPPAFCLQNWNAKAPVLAVGQQSEANGVRCTSARNGITCVRSSGAGLGKGFRVSATEAVRVTTAG